MAAMKLTAAVLLATAFIVMAAFGPTCTEAMSDCAQSCMPNCMKVKGSSTAQCEQACDQFCMTQGSPPIHIFPGRT